MLTSKYYKYMCIVLVYKQYVYMYTPPMVTRNKQAIGKPHLLLSNYPNTRFSLSMSPSISLSLTYQQHFPCLQLAKACVLQPLCDVHLNWSIASPFFVFFYFFFIIISLLCLAIWYLALAWCLLFKQKIRALGRLVFDIICSKFEFFHIISEVVALCLQYYEDGNRGFYIAELRF